MYRQLAQQSPLPQIYCFREDCRDPGCGKFHSHRHLKHSNNNNVRHMIGTIETAAIESNSSAVGKAATIKERPQLTIRTHAQQSPSAGDESNHSQQPPKLNLVSPDSVNSLPNGTLTLALPPVSPQPASLTSPAGSQTSHLSSSVTLEDIIASARRKISEEYQEIRLPSPEFVEEDNTLWDRRAAKKKLIFHESSLDIPAMEHAGEPIFRFGRGGDMNQYEDQDSEAELAIHEEPPSFIGEDDEAEDFEEMLKAAKPPSDSFSNPILLRDSDPLMATRKKNRHKRQQQLLRQQSIARIQHLGGAISISQRSSPSVNTDLGDDGGETSSIDLSMTELSAAVGQGKSPAGSTGASPSHILKFIEEQKQKVTTVDDASTEF